ncbi:hypothetical protein [Actinomadura mexicana]|uniref:hypothetical protein n=1 Tax=Actinomadura mexicana TaxID=134959 RepID=UPI000B78A0BB|nr:hypothetical protein [Actinomadura mexicana]
MKAYRKPDRPGRAATYFGAIGAAEAPPVDLDAENPLDPAVRDLPAFARQKVDEVAALGEALRGNMPGPVAQTPSPTGGVNRSRVVPVTFSRRHSS